MNYETKTVVSYEIPKDVALLISERFKENTFLTLYENEKVEDLVRNKKEFGRRVHLLNPRSIVKMVNA